MTSIKSGERAWTRLVSRRLFCCCSTCRRPTTSRSTPSWPRPRGCPRRSTSTCPTWATSRAPPNVTSVLAPSLLHSSTLINDAAPRERAHRPPVLARGTARDHGGPGLCHAVDPPAVQQARPKRPRRLVEERQPEATRGRRWRVVRRRDQARLSVSALPPRERVGGGRVLMGEEAGSTTLA